MPTKIDNLTTNLLGIRSNGKVIKEEMEKVFLPAQDELAKHISKRKKGINLQHCFYSPCRINSFIDEL